MFAPNFMLNNSRSSAATTTITCFTSGRFMNRSAECNHTARPPSGANGFLYALS